MKKGFKYPGFFADRAGKNGLMNRWSNGVMECQQSNNPTIQYPISIPKDQDRRLHPMRLIIALCISLWLLNGCGSAIPRIPASGELNGQKIETTVDSESARYYLEYYLSDQRSDSQLDSLLDEIHRQNEGRRFDREFLRALSEKFSVDFASLYLAKYILEDETNRAIQSVYQNELNKVRSELKGGFSPSSLVDSSYLILFVPGWDYAASGAITGADFANPRRIISGLGIENRLIEIDPNGTVEHNAAIIAGTLSRYITTERQIILVSASSGGPAAAQALGELLTAAQTRSVKAWVNIGGILQGSPVADHYLSWPRSWLMRAVLLFKGWSVESVRSMSAEKSRLRFSRLHFPEHLLIVNYIGIPLSGDISERAQDSYQVLRKLGPNDGLTLITDEIAPQSATITDLGTDHFFNEDPEIDLKTVALARTVLNVLEVKENGFPRMHAYRFD
jgi:hypothetical protein